MALFLNWRRWFWAAVALLLLGVLGFVAWHFWPRPAPPFKPDPVAATQANLRGVGLMERFEYPSAVKAFEEVVALDPDWLPGYINLGIALLHAAGENKNPEKRPDDLKRAVAIFRKVLAQDPDNLHAHYCLGLAYMELGQIADAAEEFKTVTKLDPTDAHAWLRRYQSHPDKDSSPEAKEFCRKALALNPYLNAARYALSYHNFEHDEKQSEALRAQAETLRQAQRETAFGDVYTEQGRYALVIGRAPIPSNRVGPLPLFERDSHFHVALAEGTRWAKDDDLGNGVLGDLRRAVRKRFGGTVVRFDYNGDGRPDLLLLGAVVRDGEVRDLLLRNDGKGQFTDVTKEAGLGDVPASFGCSVADFDNDGRPDLLLTGPAAIRLYRNVDGQQFEDKTAAAGFDKVTGVCLGSGWIDLDQDGDLDLLVARYASSPEAALSRLKKGTGESGELLVFINIGEALPLTEQQRKGSHLGGLTCRFRPATGPKTLLVKGPVVSFAAADLDSDGDLDLVVLADGQAPVTVLNDRLLRFHRGPAPAVEPMNWNGALVLDVHNREKSDVLLLTVGGKPRLLTFAEQHADDGQAVGQWTDAGETDAPPLVQAQAVDLDLDGWTDVVGLSDIRTPVLLHNDGAGRLVNRSAALPPDMKASDLLAIAVCDLDGDCHPDILLWSAMDGLQAWHNLGNGNHALRVELTGRRDTARPPSTRTNAAGVGARIIAQSGGLLTSVENTTLSAGLGQSQLPLELGLGPAASADLVRLRWPDGVPQAELDQPACETVRLAEVNRKGSSCPVLMTWDGTHFAFVTDFLGAGSMGELAADGSTRPPRPEESVKIEAHQLVPRDGRYLLKIAEPMDELLYLDYLRLDVVDHPADTVVFPDERFATTGPAPTQEVLAFRQRIFPVRAVDHRGRDVTAILKENDGKRVDDFALRSWTGFAEDHFVELDFGDRLAGLAAEEPLYLILAGWTDYPYPESIYAAEQAGVPMVTPVLEQLGSDGKWQALGEIGFPAGLPRVMTAPVRGLAGAKTCRLRIRSNLQIYWDQIYLAPLSSVVRGEKQKPLTPDPSPLSTGERGASPQVRGLEVERATLVHRGFMREVNPGNGGPVEYDDERTESVAVSRWHGRLTRTGAVTALLQQDDDRFVLCGPGDEITVAFDARQLPPLPKGWVRSFVLRTRGYCKDASPFTATAGHVEPLPFRGMKQYPYPAAEAPPGDGLRRIEQTRPAGN